MKKNPSEMLHPIFSGEMRAARRRLMERCLAANDAAAYLLLDDYNCYMMNGDEETGRMIAMEAGIDRMREMLCKAIELFKQSGTSVEGFDAFLTMKQITRLIEKID